jgi:GNAT superfamily N-acetyltransferase
VGLRIRDFPGWNAEVAEALSALPTSPLCPPELFELLLTPRTETPKRVVVVLEGGAPVAVAGLRHAWGRWEPVTQWIVPGLPLAVRDGVIARALQAMGLLMEVAWWRCLPPPPAGPHISCVKESPTHGMALADDFEDYWRRSDNWRSVKKARTRCQSFRFEVDPMGGAEWTIRHSGAKWGIPSGITEDRLAAVSWLQVRGAHHTLVLYDGDRPVAGDTFFIDHGDMVSHTTFRDPEYDWHGVGVSLLDRGFQWGAQQGFGAIDLGGGFGYKTAWAPLTGRHYQLRVTTLHSEIGRFAGRVVSRLARASSHLTQRLALSRERSS